MTKHRLIVSNFKHDCSFVISNGNKLPIPVYIQRPGPFHIVVDGLLLLEGLRMPELQTSVLAYRYNDRKLEVEHRDAHIVLMAFQSGNTLLGLVVPNLDQAVVSPTDQVRLIASIVIDAVDSVLMAIQSKMGLITVYIPHLHGFVQGGTGKYHRISWVEWQHHDIMGMLFELPNKRKSVHVPQLDEPIIWGGEDPRLGRMD